MRVTWCRRGRHSPWWNETMRCTLVASLCAPAAALLFCGCGASTAPTPSAAATSAAVSPPAGATQQSQGAFIDSANSVCTGFRDQASAVPAPSVSSISSPSAAELPVLVPFFDRVLSALGGLDSQLKGLGQPPADESRWTACASTSSSNVPSPTPT